MLETETGRGEIKTAVKALEDFQLGRNFSSSGKSILMTLLCSVQSVQYFEISSLVGQDFL
jgi:hypothetical protein